MVGHQAVGMDPVIVAAPVLTEPGEIALVVPVIEESLAPLIATDDDVIEQTGGEQSGSACHDPSL